MRSELNLMPPSDYAIPSDNSLMILDEDAPFRTRLGRALEHRGFAVEGFETLSEAKFSLRNRLPAFAVIDIRLADGNGLDMIDILIERRPDAKIIMLTGFGNIATAVSAIKRGAVDYLAKPADVDDVCKALLAEKDQAPQPPENPMSADRVKWEHIHRVYELCGKNVSETARRLSMHRRTLQRILAKRAPR